MLDVSGPSPLWLCQFWAGGARLCKKASWASQQAVFFLPGLCFSSCLQIHTLCSCPGFSWWWTLTWKPDKPLLTCCFCSVPYHSNREQTKTGIGTMEWALLWLSWSCWCGGLWRFLEHWEKKPLNAHNLSCYGNLKDNAERYRQWRPGLWNFKWKQRLYQAHSCDNLY